MFWHNLKYEVLSGLRVKDVLFWLILFPIVLQHFSKLHSGVSMKKQRSFRPFPWQWSKQRNSQSCTQY